MKIKNIVKVMNFHSLLRVNKAINQAKKYIECENQLTMMINNIQNNRNFILDKKALIPKKDKKELNIYIGSDLGFCGNLNVEVSSYLFDDKKSDKIIIGKKLVNKKDDNTLLFVDIDEFDTKFNEIESIIKDSIENLKNSKINIIYKKYINTNDLETVKKCVFPMSNDDKTIYTEDFSIEGDINTLMVNLITLYINYELKIAIINSSASENILRQNITNESLKKIDEIEQAENLRERKEKNYINFKKQIENSTRIKREE